MISFTPDKPLCLRHLLKLLSLFYDMCRKGKNTCTLIFTIRSCLIFVNCELLATQLEYLLFKFGVDNVTLSFSSFLCWQHDEQL